MDTLESVAEDFKALLSSESFQREIHHLLWITPRVNRGKNDQGWNCREHALMVGALAMLRGLPSVVLRGRAAFVHGGTAGCPSAILEMNTHWWLRTERVGSCDLSANPLTWHGTRLWPKGRSTGLVGGRYLPEGAVGYASLHDGFAFDQRVNMATNLLDQAHAVYSPQEFEHLGIQQIERAMNWCNSPLTVQLKKQMPTRSDLYAKAILHLDDFARGGAQSVADSMQIVSWRKIAARPGNGRAELLDRLQTIGVRPLDEGLLFVSRRDGA